MARAAPAWVSAERIQAALLETARPFKPDFKKAEASSLQNATTVQAVYAGVTRSRVGTAGLTQAIAALKERGYQVNGKGTWLNGKCLFHEHHAHGDLSPSGGLNLSTGVFHCFVGECDDHSLEEVLARLELLETQEPQAGDNCNSPRKGKFEKLFRSMMANLLRHPMARMLFLRFTDSA
jgi:hypothetical protein